MPDFQAIAMLAAILIIVLWLFLLSHSASIRGRVILLSVALASISWLSFLEGWVSVLLLICPGWAICMAIEYIARETRKQKEWEALFVDRSYVLDRQFMASCVRDLGFTESAEPTRASGGGGWLFR
mgnify:CR=1 FL=1